MKRALLIMLACLALATAAFPQGAAEGQTPVPCGNGPMNLEQAISDQAQVTTIGFSGLAMITGNLQAQSFFPPGKLVDYWGFQYLRDNDPDNMGHNTSFLTRVSCDVLYILNDAQFAQLKSLASGQVAQINQYGYQRYALMKAFRRLLDGDLPTGTKGLDRSAVMAYSGDLYQLDGQISFDRAAAYAAIFRSFTADQKAFLDGMVGNGWASWPDKDMDDVRQRMQGLSQDEAVAVMTYAGDMFSWYAGCVAADIYFCPERHGTYFGGFYIKDAPAIGHEGYSIDETLTATAGSALCDSAKGYVTAQQVALVAGLVETQRDNLYAGSSSIVQARTDISNALRSLIGPTEPSADVLVQVRETVLEKSALYGQLDGENNYYYATVFSQVAASLSDSQRANLVALRASILSGTYSNGTPFDFTVCDTYYLFSAPISDTSALDPYISDTDSLFSAASLAAAFSFSPAAPAPGAAVQFTDASTGAPTAWAWDFGDGAASSLQNPSHIFVSAGTYTVTLRASDASGSDTASRTVTVAAGQSSLSLASDAGAAGGTLPAEYTCDGTGASPAFSWSGAPAGTARFALMMTTIPVDGGTKWNWVLYDIPGTASGLAKNTSGVGIPGTTTHGTPGYDPPCSQGPGTKFYTFTLYALSSSPVFPPGTPVTGEALTQAIASITLGSSSITLGYARPDFSASFSYSPAAPTDASPVTFTASVSGGSQPYTFSWDLGGTQASGNPVQAQLAAGSHTVVLTVTDPSGQQTQATRTVVVTHAGALPGDCDGDGTVTIGELQRAVNMFLGLEATACGADCDGDGAVSIGELQKAVNAFLGMASTCS